MGGHANCCHAVVSGFGREMAVSGSQSDMQPVEHIQYSCKDQECVWLVHVFGVSVCTRGCVLSDGYALKLSVGMCETTFAAVHVGGWMVGDGCMYVGGVGVGVELLQASWSANLLSGKRV